MSAQKKWNSMTPSGRKQMLEDEFEEDSKYAYKLSLLSFKKLPLIWQERLDNLEVEETKMTNPEFFEAYKL